MSSSSSSSLLKLKFKFVEAQVLSLSYFVRSQFVPQKGEDQEKNIKRQRAILPREKYHKYSILFIPEKMR
jgi:hypothetical protein